MADKTWRDMNSAERAVHKQETRGLGAGITKTVSPDTVDAPPEVIPSTETVPVTNNTITKEEVETMMANLVSENNRLKTNLRQISGEADWKPVKPIVKRTYTATLKRWQKDGNYENRTGLIIDWKFLKNVFDEITRKHDKPVYKITLRYKGGETEDCEILWEDFAKISDIEVVEILENDTQTFEKVTGKKRTNFIMKDGYKTLLPSDRAGQGDVIELKETKDITMMTVKLEDGEVITLNALRLNA